MQNLVEIAKAKGATIIYTVGTPGHEFGQQKLLYHYVEDSTIDFRIVETVKFEEVKGCKILCIPELRSADEEIYTKAFNSGWYDEAFLHATFQGAGMVGPTERLFKAEDFKYLCGPAISGHIHNGGCFNGFYYYNGCPYRWKFGEEEDKGYIILAHDLDTMAHWVQFEKIESFRYVTIYLDQLVSSNPKDIIDNINQMKAKTGIEYIKVRFRCPVEGADKTIINNYYRNNTQTKIEFLDTAEVEEQHRQLIEETESKYSYFKDNSISDIERFVRFVNDSEGSEFITVEKLTELLREL